MCGTRAHTRSVRNSRTARATSGALETAWVSVTVDGTPVGTPVTVDPGTTETGTTDLSGYEDQTKTP